MNLPPAGSSLHFFAMNEIRLFVSGYQRHFWISARHATEALFRALDKELHVEASTRSWRVEPMSSESFPTRKVLCDSFGL